MLSPLALIALAVLLLHIVWLTTKVVGLDRRAKALEIALGLERDGDEASLDAE